jgi:hypothetical protein
MMALTAAQLNDTEVGFVRAIHGGRLEYYSPTELRWEPYVHGLVALWQGSTWAIFSSDSYVSISNSSLDINGNTLVFDLNYDVFLYPTSSSAFAAILSPWASNNTRVADLTRWEGVLVFDSSTSLGRQKRYIGTVRLINSSGAKFADDINHRLVANWDNKKFKQVMTYNTSVSSWTPGVQAAWIEYRAGGNQVRGEFISLVAGQGINGFASMFRDAWNREPGMYAVGINTISSTHIASKVAHNSSGSGLNMHFVTCFGETLLGYNYITQIVRTASDSSGYNCDNGLRGNAVVWVEV